MEIFRVPFYMILRLILNKLLRLRRVLILAGFTPRFDFKVS